MVDVYLDSQYTLHVTRRELRVIGLALAGRLEKEEDVVEARSLNERLVRVLLMRADEQSVHWRNIIDREFKPPEEEKP